MNLKSFEYLIEGMKSCFDHSDKFYKLGLEIDSISDPYHKIISHLLKVYYGTEGEDWISWFIYERDPEGGPQAWDKDGKEICYDIESLWDCVEKIRVSSDFQEYTPTPEMTEEERKEFITKMIENFKSDGI